MSDAAYPPICGNPAHAYYEKDIAEDQERNRVLKGQLNDMKGKLAAWLGRFGVDIDDEIAVKRLRDDMVAFNRFHGRQVSAKERIGDTETSTVVHYERKLAAKKAEIRRLQRLVQELRDAANR